MACHLLLAVFSLVVQIHAVYSAITAQEMLAAITQFSDDFTWPRINEVSVQANYTGFTPDGMSVTYTLSMGFNNFLNINVNSHREGRHYESIRRETVEYRVYLWAVFFRGEYQYYKAPWSSWERNNHIRRSPLTRPPPWELAINPPVISFSSIRDFDWGPVTIPLQIDVWFLFDNESGLIAQYDITFRRLQWAIDYLKPFLKPQLVEELGSMVDNPEDVDDLKHLRAAIDVCREHELHCLGADQQYESTQACIDYIYNKIPLGEVCEWGGDNAMCRYIHKDMIQYRPSVHCPHIRHAITHAFDPHTNPQNSPSGGEMCIKRNYINETTRKLYSAPFMPSLSSPS